MIGKETFFFLQIIFPNGSIDPWHALGILKDASSTEHAIYIEGEDLDHFGVHVCLLFKASLTAIFLLW